VVHIKPWDTLRVVNRLWTLLTHGHIFILLSMILVYLSSRTHNIWLIILVIVASWFLESAVVIFILDRGATRPISAMAYVSWVCHHSGGHVVAICVLLTSLLDTATHLKSRLSVHFRGQLRMDFLTLWVSPLATIALPRIVLNLCIGVWHSLS
jgi:hypothetical protein